ncbi:MAG TPA: hypothetical protein VGD78_21615 [Chthoniobacterales bacterium]
MMQELLQRNAELCLTAGTAKKHHEHARDLQGNLAAMVLLNERKA